MRFAHQNALPETVEGRYAQTFGGFAVEQAVDALAHLTRCLVSKGNCADMLRGVTFLNQPGDFARDDTGFAASGPGQHQARSIDAGNCLLLRRIEIFKVQG